MKSGTPQAGRFRRNFFAVRVKRGPRRRRGKYAPVHRDGYSGGNDGKTKGGKRMMETVDVAIIGGGITGCAIAYELSKTTAKVALLEKSNDVAAGATRANSGIIHAGYDPLPGTKMARYNVEGNALTRRLAADLHVPYRGNGSLVLALGEGELPAVRQLYERGMRNGVPGLRLLTGEETRQKEPRISPEVAGALWAPTAGIISPWEMAIALAETAVVNGCGFYPCWEVTGLRRTEEGLYQLTSARGELLARFVVNAAGTHGDRVAALAGPPPFRILPNRGQYYLLDKSQGDMVDATIFQCPSAAGKGVLVAPTVHGNLIVGPDAETVEDPDDVAVTSAGLARVAQAARRSLPDLSLRETIRHFAGVRAISDQEDFILEQAAGHPRLIHVSGIKSPGLTSAPALARDCAALLREAGLEAEEKGDFRLCPRPKTFRAADAEERAAMIRSNPLYGRVICRCETITEAEIVAAVRSPIPARSVDGVKRRAGAGMGRCQGGFCGPRVAAILAREWGIPLPQVLMDRPGTELLAGETKQDG